jgi:hypothetical protein
MAKKMIGVAGPARLVRLVPERAHAAQQATAKSLIGLPQTEKATMSAAFCLFLKASRKKLVGLGLRFLIHLGVISERQVELLAELGSLGVRERVLTEYNHFRSSSNTARIVALLSAESGTLSGMSYCASARRWVGQPTRTSV